MTIINYAAVFGTPLPPSERLALAAAALERVTDAAIDYAFELREMAHREQRGKATDDAWQRVALARRRYEAAVSAASAYQEAQP